MEGLGTTKVDGCKWTAPPCALLVLGFSLPLTVKGQMPWNASFPRPCWMASLTYPDCTVSRFYRRLGHVSCRHLTQPPLSLLGKPRPKCILKASLQSLLTSIFSEMGSHYVVQTDLGCKTPLFPVCPPHAVTIDVGHMSPLCPVFSTPSLSIR